MKATYNEDGTVTLVLTSAEAHILIWGGKPEILDAIIWDVRHTLVAAEDEISESDYDTIMQEVEEYQAVQNAMTEQGGSGTGRKRHGRALRNP